MLCVVFAHSFPTKMDLKGKGNSCCHDNINLANCNPMLQARIVIFATSVTRKTVQTSRTTHQKVKNVPRNLQYFSNWCMIMWPGATLVQISRSQNLASRPAPYEPHSFTCAISTHIVLILLVLPPSSNNSSIATMTRAQQTISIGLLVTSVRKPLFITLRDATELTRITALLGTLPSTYSSATSNLKRDNPSCTSCRLPTRNSFSLFARASLHPPPPNHSFYIYNPEKKATFRTSFYTSNSPRHLISLSSRNDSLTSFE